MHVRSDCVMGDIIWILFWFVVNQNMSICFTSETIGIITCSKTITVGIRNKKRRPGKPWWSDNLSNKWSEKGKAEREWLDCSLRHDKIKLKSIFVRLRKTFVREVQKTERLYWYTIQNNLLNDCESHLLFGILLANYVLISINVKGYRWTLF